MRESYEHELSVPDKAPDNKQMKAFALNEVFGPPSRLGRYVAKGLVLVSQLRAVEAWEA